MLRSALIAKLNSENKKNRKNDLKKSSVSTIKKVSKKVKTSVRKQESERKNIFDEEICELGVKFRIEPENVKKAIEGLIKFTTENPKLKNKLFDDEEFSIFLQINSIKVPQGYSRIIRIPLKHSMYTPDSEICLIVSDVKGIPNKNHEQHLEQYEKLLHQKGIININKIMTFHEFRTEYENFESRRRLVELYDVFLVDGKISGKTVKKCGKIFYKKRKVPTAVKLRATKLKEHIDQTLKKSPLYFRPHGDSFCIQIGHSKMKPENIVDNVLYVANGLEKEFPGGFGNVRSLNVFAYRGISIPIYTTLKNKNDVDLSKNVREQKTIEPVSGEISTRLNSGVIVKPTGEVEVYKLKIHKKKKTE